MHKDLNRYMTEFNKMLFHNGFYFKQFELKHLDYSTSVKISHEELSNFQSMLNRNSDGRQPEDNEDFILQKAIQQTLMQGGNTVYTKGDKIQINKGDLMGIRGTVISIEEGGMVTFKPIGFPELEKPLQIDLGFVSKYFEPGDPVRITEGKYKGETGQVIDVEGRKVSLVLDQSQQEIKIFTNHLKLKSDTDQLVGHNGIQVTGGAGHGFQAGDLVQYNGNKNAGLVLQVQEDYLKMINEQGKTVNIKICDLGKKIPPPSKSGTLSAHDKHNFTLSFDAVVKVEEGPNRGIIGSIRHCFKQYLFLHNKEFVQSNGIFVEGSRRVSICGAEFMKGNQGSAVAS